MLNYLFPLAAGFVLAIFLCLPFARPQRPVWLLACLVYLLADAMAVLIAPSIPGTHWNWVGKFFSIVLALVAMGVLRLSRDEMGLRMPAGDVEWKWTVIGIVIAIVFDAVIIYFFRDHHKASLETFCYEASMPGLAEELAYRGVAFALFNRAYSSVAGKWKGMPAVFIPSLIFGLGHGFSRDNGGAHFAWMPFAFSLLLGCWFAFVRLRSGSLLGPVLAHNGANVAGDFVNGLS